jgi:hypothetical protein
MEKLLGMDINCIGIIMILVCKFFESGTSELWKLYEDYFFYYIILYNFRNGF